MRLELNEPDLNRHGDTQSWTRGNYTLLIAHEMFERKGAEYDFYSVRILYKADQQHPLIPVILINEAMFVPFIQYDIEQCLIPVPSNTHPLNVETSLIPFVKAYGGLHLIEPSGGVLPRAPIVAGMGHRYGKAEIHTRGDNQLPLWLPGNIEVPFSYKHMAGHWLSIVDENTMAHRSKKYRQKLKKVIREKPRD